MKRPILILLILALIGGGAYWMKRRAAGPAGAAAEVAPEKKAADDKPEGARLTRDEHGNAVVNINDEAQGNAGIKVANPSASQLAPEVKGYGRVVDPAPLSALLTELAMAQAAYPASSNELVRLKTLSGQGNASVRALQAAEAAALHDQLTIQSVRDRLLLSWGNVVANHPDLPAFIHALTSLNTVLARIDLPAGEKLAQPPATARLASLAGNSIEADLLSLAPNVDPQTQGQGFIFLIKENTLRLLPGEALTGYLKVPGEPLSGVVIPRDAVVRTEGSTWVYLLNAGGESFTRIEIPLEHPTDNGWLVMKGIKPSDYVVINGAQTILSEELKALVKPD